jgi:hypothetical protein
MRHASTLAAVVVALLAGAPATSPAQDLAAQVNRVREGDVRLSFALRPGVCGQGRNVWYSGRSSVSSGDMRSNRDVEYDIDCDPGPGRLVVIRRDGEVAGIRFYVGGRWRASAQATDLGDVSSRAAAEYLIGLAETNDGRPGRDAIFPATLVDSVTVWPMLMRIARNERRPRNTREGATFWLGQLAEEPATRGLTELVGDDTLDRAVRESAIFALSQRRDREGVPALINVVRTSPDPELRKKALFWLAQSKDPRALDLIEELLTKR